LKTQKAITKLGWAVLPHPHNSQHLPQLSASLSLKNAIRWKRFGSDDAVTDEEKEWLGVQNSNWYKREIVALVCRWGKTTDGDGKCAEK
jgi:hypothetical protein